MSESKVITHVGLDVHKAGINVALIGPDSKAVAVEWQIANESRAILRMVRKVKQLGSEEVIFCYEAGPCGYALQRQLVGAGVGCVVVAPSLIPAKPGDRVKTDRRDSRKLAELFKAGLLTEVHPPLPEEEAVRDLTRAREDANRELLSARHRLSKMLMRHGLVYGAGCNWTQRHRVWLKSVRFELHDLQEVLDNYLLSMEQIEDRLRHLGSHLEEVAKTDRYAERVGWLCCLRGVNTVTAMTILSELHDPSRFGNPRELMSYLGLTPSEYSSGGRTRRGGITKAGNGHVRRVLVEAAWAYRHRSSVSAHMARRRQGQPAEVIAIADRAQLRLHKRYFRLKEGLRKHHNVVTVAVARELVGFVWSILQHKKAA
jgi:transposase